MIVDTVSALAGVDFEMDAWGIDIAVTATQKCMGGVVGMSMVAVNDKAWKYFEKKAGTGFYFNLNTWRDSVHNNVIHPHPWSMSETLVYSLNTACDLILEEGLDQRIARHWALYDYYETELTKLGFSMFVPRACACPTVISINTRPDLPVEVLAARLKEEYGILIGVGIYQQRGKIWRIGNMAEQADFEKAKKLVESISAIVQEGA